MIKETTQAIKSLTSERDAGGWMGEENRCRDCGGMGISTSTTLNS